MNTMKEVEMSYRITNLIEGKIHRMMGAQTISLNPSACLRVNGIIAQSLDSADFDKTKMGLLRFIIATFKFYHSNTTDSFGYKVLSEAIEPIPSIAPTNIMNFIDNHPNDFDHEVRTFVQIMTT